MPAFKVLLNKVHIKFASHSYSSCNSEWSYQRITNDNPKTLHHLLPADAWSGGGVGHRYSIVLCYTRVARHSLVNKTDLNLPSCDFLPTLFSILRGCPLMQVKPLGFHILQRFSEYGIELIWAHQEHQRLKNCFASFKRATWTSPLILLMARCDTGAFVWIFPLSERPMQSSGFVTNFLIVRWSRSNSLAICKVDYKGSGRS